MATIRLLWSYMFSLVFKLTANYPTSRGIDSESEFILTASPQTILSGEFVRYDHGFTSTNTDGQWGESTKCDHKRHHKKLQLSSFCEDLFTIVCVVCIYNFAALFTRLANILDMHLKIS